METEWPCQELVNSLPCLEVATFAHVAFMPSGSTHVAAYCDKHKAIYRHKILLSMQQGAGMAVEPPKKTPERELADSVIRIIRTLRDMHTTEAQTQLERIEKEL